ncbi:DUF4189 domain-containing protein [Mycolicibacterium peregrinum]|uniref:DUF4189 domain-containing protein n=1 Tax=Mycolicibacterium peregrinum TaxID=43304 RepID=A0A1A0V7T3_MYCPR|nr:DUF4189 domain-containing protein [Mycolicibacterium peregrinum]OBB79293.1 hypothetical protein A5779_12940 [Mycolicibacterium peregrinum]
MEIKSFARRAAVAGIGAVTVGATQLVAPTGAHAALSYGAIAYSENGAGAAVWHYPSAKEASAAAVQYCGYTSCEPMNTFTDCGVAVRNDTHVQTAHGPTLGAATRAALNAIPGGGGYIDIWACN